MRYSKIIVVLVIVLNTVFTASVLYVYKTVGSEPSILIGGWFAFTTGELWALAMLKNKESKNEIQNKNEKDCDIGEHEIERNDL